MGVDAIPPAAPVEAAASPALEALLRLQRGPLTEALLMLMQDDAQVLGTHARLLRRQIAKDAPADPAAARARHRLMDDRLLTIARLLERLRARQVEIGLLIETYDAAEDAA